MEALLRAIREACPPGLWSQGVSLARTGAVVVVQQRPSEVTCRVRAPGHRVAPTVVLYLGDLEWSCDCGGKVDPCAHVAAAAFAVRDAAAAAASAQSVGASPGDPREREIVIAPTNPAPAPAELSYELSRLDGILYLERAFLHPDGRREPIQGFLATAITRGSPAILPTHEDLLIDRMVASFRQGMVPPSRVRELFTALEGAPSVLLDGCPVTTSGRPVAPRAVLLDGRDGGVTVRIEADPTLDEVVARGVARCGAVLAPLAETALTGELLEKLPLERSVPRAGLGEIVSKILPDLEKTMPVTIRTRRLPGMARSGKPRISMQLSQGGGHTLAVLPLLVYGDPPQARIDNGTLVHLRGAIPVRDVAAEKRLIERLRDELNLVPNRRVELDGDTAVRFAQKLTTWRDGEQTETLGEIFNRTPLVPRVAITGDMVDITFDTEPGGEGGEDIPARRASADAVIRAWKAGLDFVPLDGGGWAPLPADWLARFGDRVADLLQARAETEDGRVPPAFLPALSELCDELEAPRPPGLERLRPLLEGFQGIPEAELPPHLADVLRPYQRRGVDWLSFLRSAGLGGVLADDMGLGKTIQALAAITGRTLVVCPTSVLWNWEAEAKKFRPELTVTAYHGPGRALDRAADVTLTTYAVMRLDSEVLAAEAWDAIVLDEAQTIKNPDSQVARAAYTLKADFRLTLSGTPVENRLLELWSQMHFVNRGLLGGRADFLERYAGPIEAGDAAVAAKLRDRIRPFVLRRRKLEVAPELPPRMERITLVELDERERNVYDVVRAASLSQVQSLLNEGGGGGAHSPPKASVLAVLEALLRLRQAACHSALVPGQEASTSSKVDALVEALADAAADGHKALVFSQWTSLLDRVEPHLREAGISFNRLDGSTRDRAGVVSEFQAESGPPVMLLSLKAGGTGLNLTAADHVFLLDPWWNPAVEDQAADRAHRIGQDKPVLITRLVAKDTVEERILSLAQRKRAVAAAVLGEAGGAAAITREELISLIS
jgi:superfamily II DNA or RNA helicase